MLAARTILGEDEEDMIIYYKTSGGNWINALTGESVTVPSTVDVEVIDLNAEGEITIVEPELETYELDSDSISSSTYVIGDYLFTRNQNESHQYDGRLTTGRIMLASKTIIGTEEEDMIIYYRTAGGIWIDALTGEEVDAPVKYEIGVVDLVNQENERMSASLISGNDFNNGHV